MYENDVWSGLADFLANMIEKYAGEDIYMVRCTWKVCPNF